MTKQRPKKQLILLGNGGIGKTSLAGSLYGKTFAPETSTTGIDTSFFGENNSIQIIDFPAQEIYQEKYRGTVEKLESAVALIVVDRRMDNVFTQTDYWNSVLDKNENIVKHLVITKSDTGGAAVDEHRLREQYDFRGIHKTSAKTAAGIQELRESINNSFNLLHDEPEDDEDPVSIIVQSMVDQLCKLIAKIPDALNNIEWRDLERIIATALAGLGFEISLTAPSKDGGKDVVARCIVSNEKKTYYIEIKHWRNGGRPGFQHVSDFIQVNAKNGTDGGLFLSSSGYTNSVYDQVNEIIRQNVQLGDTEKIVSLCQRYVCKEGLWQKKSLLPDLLFEETIR